MSRALAHGLDLSARVRAAGVPLLAVPQQLQHGDQAVDGSSGRLSWCCRGSAPAAGCAGQR